MRGLKGEFEGFLPGKTSTKADQVSVDLEIWDGAVSLLMRCRGVKFLGSLEIDVS